MKTNPENTDEIALLSYSEAAKRMGIGRDTLRGLIRDGKIGIIRVGNRPRIPVREILKFIDENTVRVDQRFPVYNQKKPTMKSTDEIFREMFEAEFGKGKVKTLK